MTPRLVALLATLVCLLCAACGGGESPSTAAGAHGSKTSSANAYASARAELSGMRCASVGLLGGAAVGRYRLYVCAGPDEAGIGVPKGAYVCWGFHDFGAGHDQPAVELNVMDATGRTIGGHVFPDTTLNCRRTLRAVAGLLS